MNQIKSNLLYSYLQIHKKVKIQFTLEFKTEENDQYSRTRLPNENNSETKEYTFYPNISTSILHIW